VDAFHLDNLMERQKESGRAYLEFLRVPAMSAGLYVLPVGAIDAQQPHTEDEMYYITSGRGMFTCAGEECSVEAGSVLFVASGVEHRFHSIAEDLHILVFFAPAEYTNIAPTSGVSQAG
jgi:quercetin dioxygenase-like cupin family protein